MNLTSALGRLLVFPGLLFAIPAGWLFLWIERKAVALAQQHCGELGGGHVRVDDVGSAHRPQRPSHLDHGVASAVLDAAGELGAHLPGVSADDRDSPTAVVQLGADVGDVALHTRERVRADNLHHSSRAHWGAPLAHGGAQAAGPRM